MIGLAYQLIIIRPKGLLDLREKDLAFILIQNRYTAYTDKGGLAYWGIGKNRVKTWIDGP